MRFMLEIIGVKSYDAEIEENLNSMRYRELARPLILKDKDNGTDFGMLKVRFGMNKHQLRRLLNTYYNENSDS